VPDAFSIAIAHPTNEEKTLQYHKVTANLMVSDMDGSTKFYTDVLGLERQITVPEQPPFVFVAVGTAQVEIFLNKDEPASPAKPGGISLYVELQGLDQLLARVQERNVKIEIPLHETFYGMREFAVLDPDGYLIILAERMAK
jgi:catechol 2,3-dioxygenase-like lactoylglutathione lyase family enzyme